MVPPTAASFGDCQWTRVRFERKTLLTSDHPVSMNVYADFQEWSGVGVFNADSFTLPLTRRLGLFIQPRRKFEAFGLVPEDVPDFVAPGNSVWARVINQQTVPNARRYVFIHAVDALDPNIVIPEPSTFGSILSQGVGEFVKEEGIQSSVDAESLGSIDIDQGNVSVSLDDISWRIPGRVRP